MVSSPDKKALYAIGGYNGTNYNNDIFKFHCTGNINTCRWTKSETALRFGRRAFVAIPLPNSLADKLCSTAQCDYYDDYIDDGFCDDETNLAECGYDGGDCCGDDVWTEFCIFCICHQI